MEAKDFFEVSIENPKLAIIKSDSFQMSGYTKWGQTPLIISVCPHLFISFST
jgi:hypothetical protein